MIRTYKYRLRPNKGQEETLDFLFWQARDLYNAALEQRTAVYQETGKGINYGAQWAHFRDERNNNPDTFGMLNATVSEYLIKNYKNYYEDSDKEWRRLGALDKSNNIFALCSNIPHNKILEIGAGDGAILQQLAEQKFGKELFALEIADTAVNKILSLSISSIVECKWFDGYSFLIKTTLLT